jgi:hypothetical protein
MGTKKKKERRLLVPCSVVYEEFSIHTPSHTRIHTHTDTYTHSHTYTQTDSDEHMLNRVH